VFHMARRPTPTRPRSPWSRAAPRRLSRFWQRLEPRCVLPWVVAPRLVRSIRPWAMGSHSRRRRPLASG
jgi:hypothetical protein